ncbi:MAG: hypothetical protein HKN87_06435 [Saprospiraceae bacterium]|nr:hypothetical protein [Saprospiraceae bacterium]
MTFSAKSTFAIIHLTVLNKKEVLYPGNAYTILIRVENRGDAVSVEDLNVEIPEQWSLITQSFPEVLKKDGTGTVFITFKTPEKEQAGSFEVVVKLETEGEVVANEQLTFLIEQVHSIDLQVIGKPSQINGAGPYECEFLVTNTGNMSEVVQLKSRSASMSEQQLDLDAWESKAITLNSYASEQILSAKTLIVDLQATLESRDTQYSLNIPIPFFPTKTLKVDKYLRFPISISGSLLSFSGQRENVLSGRFNIKGRGHIDRRQKLLLSLIASGPNQFQQARFGQYDQYSIGLAARSFGELELGDFGVSISPLTEQSRFGRGVSYRQILGPMEFSAFKIKPRFFPDSDNIYGFKGRFAISDKMNLEANWVNKSNSLLEENPEAIIRSIASDYVSGKVSFSVEAAQSKYLDTDDYAIQTEIDYSDQSMQVSANFLYAGPEFKGYYRNSIFGSVRARYSLTDNISLSISGSQSEINPQQDTLSITILPKHTFASIGLQYKYSAKESFTFQVLQSRKKDRIYPVDFNYYDRLIQGSYYRRDDISDLSIDASYGKTRNFLIDLEEDQEGNSFRTIVLYGRQLLPRFRVGGQLEYINTNKFTDQRTNQKLLFYGARLNHRVGDKLSLSFDYRSNFPVDELYQPRSFIDGEVSYRWSPRQRLSASMGYALFPGTSDAKQFFFSGKYEQTLNVPLKKVLQLGSLSGRLIGNNGEKIAGVRISVADQEVATDLTGNFEFNDLPLGQNFVHLKAGSLSINEITKGSSPFAVDIKQDISQQIEIEIVKCGAIKGTIAFEEDQSTQSEAFVKKRPEIFLKVWNDSGTLFTKVDSNGTFQFLGLRPGIWKLAILDSGWSTNFRIDNTEEEIVLSANQEVILNFELKPKSRKLKFSKKTLKISLSND